MYVSKDVICGTGGCEQTSSAIMLWAKRVCTYVVGGRVGMNDTCYFSFDLTKLVIPPTPPYDPQTSMFASPRYDIIPPTPSHPPHPSHHIRRLLCVQVQVHYHPTHPTQPTLPTHHPHSSMCASPRNVIIPPTPPTPPKRCVHVQVT